MNLFACDPDPVVSARSLADKHVVKMSTETAQVLWAALFLVAPDALPALDDPRFTRYKPTHIHHPCVVWAAESRANFDWAVRHGLALCGEYTARYGRVIASEAAIRSAAYFKHVLPATGRTPFVQAMPEELRGEDPHLAYRRCLNAKYDQWGSQARWTNATPPSWRETC